MAGKLCMVITCLGVLAAVGLLTYIAIKQQKCCKREPYGGYWTCTTPSDDDCGMAQLAIKNNCTPPYTTGNQQFGKAECMWQEALAYAADVYFGKTVDECKADSSCSEIAKSLATNWYTPPMASPASCPSGWWKKKSDGGMC